MRPLAYAKDLAARRRNNERIGLLIVSLNDWEAGKWFEGQPAVARVVLPDDVPVAAADWSLCLALDVLVCGDADETLLHAALLALEKAGAASLWVDYDDGVWRVERGVKLWSAITGPVPLAKLPAALRLERNVMTMLGIGFYRSRIFDGARKSMRGAML